MLRSAAADTVKSLASSWALIAGLLLLLLPVSAYTATHPRLLLTVKGVEEIRTHLGSVPLFDTTVAGVAAEVDAEIVSGVEVPVPVDFSGGYTHERHKRNFIYAEKAGALFQILGDEKYANYIRAMLFEYAALYPDLPLHPKERSYARGKLFWQCLNDANWLLYMSLAYDAIYEWLPASERTYLNTALFRPFADFISLENPQFFNRVHNHSTWGNAAVGMIGLVLDDDALIERALYGIKDDGLATGTLDDDGGFIKVKGQAVGFLANLEEPFSPDGYYTEGPYYQRYAMYPFLAFAIAMENARPEVGVLQHKDSVLIKAVDALLAISDANGEFFALNDAQKGMSVLTPSMTLAIDAAYWYGDRDPALVSIAKQQGRVRLDQSGLGVALAASQLEATDTPQASVLLSDGPDGDQGGLAVLRSDGLATVFKYTAQGLSHGHYDKLSFSLHDEGEEIIQDYGLVRFVNVEQKGGGNYLPENTTWAKQTVAHNTVVLNGESHFGGAYSIGSQHHSTLEYASIDNKSLQTVYARETNAYPGVDLRRAMSLATVPGIGRPLLIDMFKVVGDDFEQIDLPMHYLGQFIESSLPLGAKKILKPLGLRNGYQHLYEEASGVLASDEPVQFTWMNSGRFYTLSRVGESQDLLIHGRLGANDPNFNLRRDPSFIQRRQGRTDGTTFLSIVEAHGEYSPVTELSTRPRSEISALRLAVDNPQFTVADFQLSSGLTYCIAWSHLDFSEDAAHEVVVDDLTVQWTGPHAVLPCGDSENE